MGIGHSGLLKRYAPIRFAHLVDGRDLGKAPFRAMSLLGSINRINAVTKKAPRTAELLERVGINFIDVRPLVDNRLWGALMGGFFVCL